jgi:hypothetical protein
MNAVDVLMGLDVDKMSEIPEKKMKIKRISDMAGTDFIVTLRAVPAKRYTELVNDIRKKDGSVDVGKAYDANVMIVVAGMTEPSMKDKDLLARFRCSNPAELAQKIFKSSELSLMADEITELSGFGSDTVESVKN